MPQSFLDDLRGYYLKVGRVLRGEADIASVFPNTGDIGDSRERIYMEILKRHLPSCCTVFQGGFLFDQDGHVSKQIDIVVIDDISPRFNSPGMSGSGKSFACVDGCLGVVSVKSHLDTTKLEDALWNIASIPDKTPLTRERYPSSLDISGYEEWPIKVIYASSGIEMKKLLESLESFYTQNPAIPMNKRPNFIHVAGESVIKRTGSDGEETRRGVKLEPNSFYGGTTDPDVAGLCSVIGNVQLAATASRFILYDYRMLFDKLPF